MSSERYTFGDFTLDVAERRVVRQGQDVTLPPKAHDVLVELVRRGGRLVRKRELLDLVWPDSFVEEGILAVHVSSLRKVLGDDSRRAAYIETVSKTGYRFIAPVRSESVPSAASAVTSPEVYELVGRARKHLLSASRPEVPSAIQAFEAAIALDPTHAPAHAGLALACCAQAKQRFAPPHDAYGRARVSALRALALDDASADAQVALGAVMFLNEWNWIGAERSLQRALDLSPTHTQARLLYGHLLEAQGKLADGLAMKLRALEHDPFAPSVHLAIALSYWCQRNYAESIRWANKTLEADPKHLLAREFLAGAYWKLGDFDRHMEENIKHAPNFGVPAEALEPVRRVYEAEGRAGVVRMGLARAASHPASFPEMQLALFHMELGDLDAALTHLERAIEGRDPSLVDLAVAPQWDALRAHPGFQRCLASMGLAALQA
jgi:DNA-binding winged helix-turn-helix (wHTH) protein/Tfp pilus assembly protein PilF